MALIKHAALSRVLPSQMWESRRIFSDSTRSKPETVDAKLKNCLAYQWSAQQRGRAATRSLYRRVEFWYRNLTWQTVYRVRRCNEKPMNHAVWLSDWYGTSFSSVSERGTADDLTGDRGNTENDRACCTYRIAKSKEQISPSRELKDIGDDWPRLTTEYDDAWDAAGRRQRAASHVRHRGPWGQSTTQSLLVSKLFVSPWTHLHMVVTCDCCARNSGTHAKCINKCQ